MQRYNITRQRIIALRVRHGCRRIQRDHQYIHTRREYQRRAQGAKRAVAVRDTTIQRRRFTRVVRGTNATQRQRVIV